MSRAIFLNMSERTLIAHCEAQRIGISSIRKLPAGGTRLVCMSVDGARQIRLQLKSHIMKDDAALQQHGPGWGFVARN